MKVQVVLSRRLRRWVFPLVKWKRAFAKQGIAINFRAKAHPNSVGEGDVVILCDKQYRTKFKTNPQFLKNYKDDVLTDIAAFRKRRASIIFYDMFAEPACRHLWLIDKVDLLLKRQLFKDSKKYFGLGSSHPISPWVSGDNRACQGADPKYAHRIALGWNIGYWDYFSHSRLLRWSRYIRTKTPSPNIGNVSRPFVTSFRGGTSGSRSYQRERAIDIIASRADSRYVVGPLIPKKQYLHELSQCKVAVSPFGYGEICFRDFEAVLLGCVLIKPSVRHLDTYPNFFEEYVTYIPCSWDMSDLPSILDEVDSEEFHWRVASTAQDRYMALYDEFGRFSEHFIGLLNKAVSEPC